MAAEQSHQQNQSDRAWAERLELHFERLIQLDADARETALTAIGKDEPKLKDALQRWLASEERRVGFMDDPTMRNATAQKLCGTAIGPYRLRQLLGEGGYGVVYLAEQREPVARQVALKILKPGMDSAQVIARFEAERQALALMEHPNIAKVLDAGTTDLGRPFFVMELVRGVPITDYCDQRSFTTGQRLSLFKRVCLAVQHAHQKGVIHRDLKPSNILVSTNGGEAVPMVIDFGIAKATQGRLTDKTLLTHFHQFVGTPEYMSPEQAQMSNIAIDTRSDVYSLGVLLYELLTGKKPLDGQELRKSGYEEMCRRIREETAPKPSKKLGTVGEDELTTLAKQRSLTPAQFTSSIRGDLDWIVMKAVEKDVSRRYESCGALAADIERCRKNEPVLAAAPSAFYHMQKWVQRHRTAALALCGVGLALIVGTGVAIYGMLEAKRAEQVAQSEKRQAIHSAYLADMQTAHLALSRGDHAAARRILEDNREFLPDADPRHWEWRALWKRCDQSAVQFGHEDDFHTSSISLSPDDRWIAVSSREAIRVWDIEDGTILGEVTKPEGWSEVAFSQDGRYLYASFDETVRAFKAPSLANPVDAFTHDRPVYRMAVSPDGRWLAALCRVWDHHSAELSLWNLHTLQRVQHFGNLRTGNSGRLAFSLDSRQLAYGLRDSLHVMDLNSFQESDVLPHGANVAMALSPDGKHAASASGTTVNVYRLEDGKLVYQENEHRLTINDLAYSPDGRWIASSSQDETVILWEAATGRKLKTYYGLVDLGGSVRFSADSQRLFATGRAPNTINVWDIPQHFESTWPRRKKDGPSSIRMPHGLISYSADGALIASSVSGGGGIELRSPDTLEVLRPLTNKGISARFSPVSPNVIAVGMPLSGSLLLLNAASGETIQETKVLEGGGQVVPVRFSQDGAQLLVLARVDKWTTRCAIYRIPELHEVHLWNLEPEDGRDPGAAGLSPDGREVARSSYWATRFLTPGQPSEQADILFRDHFHMKGLDYSPDGHLMALGGVRKWIHLIDSQSRAVIGTLQGHLQAIAALRFSPDGKRLASAAYDDAIRIWDVATQREILTLPSDGKIEQIEWSPDGHSLLACSRARSLFLWRVPSFEDIAKAESVRR